MCDLDFDESPKVWSDTRHRARKERRCDACGGLIRVGEYEASQGDCIAEQFADDYKAACALVLLRVTADGGEQ
jgi:hypothetical protein